jgi:hypothetical protein
MQHSKRSFCLSVCELSRLLHRKKCFQYLAGKPFVEECSKLLKVDGGLSHCAGEGNLRWTTGDPYEGGSTFRRGSDSVEMISTLGSNLHLRPSFLDPETAYWFSHLEEKQIT